MRLRNILLKLADGLRGPNDGGKMAEVMDLSRARWRQAGSVHAKYNGFELYVDDTLLIELWFTNSGALQLAFSGSYLFEWDALFSVLENGRKLAENQRIEADKREASWPPEWRTPDT